MYIIKDAIGQERGVFWFPVETLEEAKVLSKEIDMNPEEFPEEYPFSVVHKDTGEVVHQWHMPTLHDGTY
jgi:hypothetical protein